MELNGPSDLEAKKDEIFEAVYMAVEGFITANELANKLERITGGKIARGEPV